MDWPTEITFRNMPRFEEIVSVVRREAAKLGRYSRRITGCRVAIERPQRFQRQGNTYRVRLAVSAGPHGPSS